MSWAPSLSTMMVIFSVSFLNLISMFWARDAVDCLFLLHFNEQQHLQRATVLTYTVPHRLFALFESSMQAVECHDKNRPLIRALFHRASEQLPPCASLEHRNWKNKEIKRFWDEIKSGTSLFIIYFAAVVWWEQQQIHLPLLQSSALLHHVVTSLLWIIFDTNPRWE